MDRAVESRAMRMRHRNEITIAASQQAVWRVFDDPDATQHWQPTLKSHTLIAGEPGEVGCVYELVFDNDGRDIKAVATLTEKQPYEIMASTTDSDTSFSTMRNRFQRIDDNHTRWFFDIEYRFKGLYKLVAFFLRKSMRVRADAEMQNFKTLVESEHQGE